MSLLCVGLLLLGALQTKSQGFFPVKIKTPPLSKVPLQDDFQDGQFQGKWYVLGIADNTIRNGNNSNITMYSMNYELKEDHSFDVNTTLLRDEVCEHSVETIVPDFWPGHFTLNNLTSHLGLMSYTMRVAETNYNQFAMVYIEKIIRFEVYYKTVLYGRTKELRPKLKKCFIRFAKTLRFTEDNISFPVPTDECIDD